MKNFRTIMMAAGAAISLLAFEPTTLLLKVAVAATGMAVGAVLSDPVAQEAAEFKKSVQELKAQMTQKPAEAEVVN
jgi:hypothetical protein